MGRAHRAEEFLALAKTVAGPEAEMPVCLSGAGPNRAAWERLGAGAFEFPPRRAGQCVCVAHLLSADVHLVSQQPEWPGRIGAEQVSRSPARWPAPWCFMVRSKRDRVMAGGVGSRLGGVPPGDETALAPAASGIRDASTRAAKSAAAAQLFARTFTRAANCRRMADPSNAWRRAGF